MRSPEAPMRPAATLAAALLGAGALLTVLPPALSQSSGREIYASSCVACHGPDGQGALPGVPDLTAFEWPSAADDAALLKRVREGFQSPASPLAMPPRGGNPALTDADLKSVLAYMKKAFGR